MNTLHRITSGLALMSLALVGCGGGGSSAGTTPTTGTTSLQRVSGTLTIGNQPISSASSSRRQPKYVSGATTHANLFINGATTTSNASSACTGTQTSGTGTFCTISWSTLLAVPASYTFAVETDNGTKVLAEGSGTYAIVAGVNTLGTLTLNGVVANASFTTTSCTNAALPGTCSGNVTLEDAAGDAIAYTGATTVPTTGISPTTGTVYDNGAVTFASSTANGLVIGTAQTTGPNVFSTFAANTLTASGVQTAGVYTFKVSCATNSTTGTFGITVGGGTTPEGAVSAGQLAALAGISYPASVATVATAPSYTCATGAIASATGTLPIN